ncbi:MAG: PEGA domain-containing protein [Deltaproteobacteria bacterium]|nr:PEGA domain-containing protein [Deltaproteobacteria bacterium]
MRLRHLALSAAVVALHPAVALAAPGAVLVAPYAQVVPGKEHAKRLFDEGVELEKKNDYAGALAKYKEAEAIAVTAGLRFHKGYCLEMLGKVSSALEEYESAEKMAREQGKNDIRTAVVTRMEGMKGRVPQISLRLATDVKGAEVMLDGAPVGAPLLDGKKAFRIDPGDHILTARAPGWKPWKREVHVPEAITTTVDISMDREGAAPAPVVVAPAANPAPASTPAPPPDAITEPPRESAPSRSVLAPALTTAGAVTLVVTGVVFFAVAGSAKSDADAQCPAKLECDSERSKVRTFDTLSLGSFIGAAGLGVLSIVLWTRTGSSHASASPSTRIVATPNGAGLAGSF